MAIVWVSLVVSCIGFVACIAMIPEQHRMLRELKRIERERAKGRSDGRPVSQDTPP